MPSSDDWPKFLKFAALAAGRIPDPILQDTELAADMPALCRALAGCDDTHEECVNSIGQPIALDVLGVAPIDRLGELTWLGPASVVVFGMVLGLVAHAFNIRNFDRWMLLLILGTFTGAYPLMYFAQEFIPLNTAIFASSGVVLLVIALRSTTIMGFRLGFCGAVLPAIAILAVTLLAAIHTRLQGILITGAGIALFIVAMLLIPRLKLDRSPRTPLAGALPAGS